MASLPGVFNLQSFTDAGDPAANYRLYTYAPGTTTHKAAYTDSAGVTPHTYVSDGLGGLFIALNARGELPAPLFLSVGGYDIQLATPVGALVGPARRATSTADSPEMSGATGAGLVGFSYAASYGAGSIGKWLKDLATSVGSAFVGFVQSGASVVTRNLQEKVRERLSMEDLGCVGDGVADDGATLNAALYARYSGLATSQSTTIVVIEGTPGKTYRFGTMVNIRQNRIRLLGRGAHIVCDGVGAFSIVQDGSGNQNEDGEIVGWRITGAVGPAIQGVAAVGWNISYNWITNGGGISLVSVAAKVRWNYLRDITGAGITLSAGYTVGSQNTWTASISGTTMTVTAFVSGPAIQATEIISGTGITPGTYIVQQLTGPAGGAGTYQVSVAQVVASGTVTGNVAAESQGCIVEHNRVYITSGLGILLQDGGGHYLAQNDCEANTQAALRLQASFGNTIIGFYAEPVNASVNFCHGIFIDSTQARVGGRSSDGNKIIGGIIGGGGLSHNDVYILGGNNNSITGLRFGDGKAQVDAGVNGTIFGPCTGLSSLTDNGSGTVNMNVIASGGWTGIAPVSSTKVPLRNIGGFVDFGAADTSKVVTLATSEDDANYRVNLTSCNIGGAPSAASKRVSMSALPTTAGFTVANEGAPGAGASVRVYYELMR